jgi:hypothetical protein
MELDAQFIEPRLPKFRFDFWSCPERANLFGLETVDNLEMRTDNA